MAALRLYLGQKGQSVEQEMVSAVDTLYAKAVPGNVREFLDLRSGMEMKPMERRKRPGPPRRKSLHLSPSRKAVIAFENAEIRY